MCHEQDIHPSDAAPALGEAGTMGPQTLLVGTALSTRQLLHILEVAEPGLHVVGALVRATSDAEPALACPVLGGFDDLSKTLEHHRVDQVLVSLPQAMGPQRRELGHQLDRLGIRWRFMPTLADQLAGRPTEPAGALRGGLPFDPAQLIDRTPRPLDTAAIGACLAGKVVLITGAGGSIGSELARAISRFGAARLVLVERAENPLFEIDRQIERVFGSMQRAAELHDVTDAEATADLVRRHRPQLIFHAAAHKHVPMMEDHPSAAVENNFYGTKSIVDAADRFGAERFVMISTDKAVIPSSVMGATKRLAELYVQHRETQSQTVYSIVRFGNVLGSACSVLPIWSDQLSRGGPISVTHPDMSRYFMSIPEAAGLVLQAAALSGSTAERPGRSPVRAARPRSGEVFLLDMGEPIRIRDLAEAFVRLHGFEPGTDIEIAFTGIRPGEKLAEVLAYESEDLIPTAHESIRLWHTAPPDPARMHQITSTFDRLRASGGGGPWRGANRDSILNALRASIPEMVRAAAG